MKKHRLRVGYVGLSLKSYFAEKYHHRERSIEGLKALAAEWDFDLIAVEEELSSETDSIRAANYLRGQSIDFLLVQNSSISVGEQFLPFVDVAPRLGLWSLPDPTHEGGVQIHSLVALNEHASILKRYLRDRDIPFKWFYDHVDTEMFRRRFGVTVRALTAVKHIEQARIGWIGGVSPGFHNMMIDPRLLHQRLGLHVGEHEMAELVRRAETYAPARVELLAAEMRGAATEVTVSSNEAFNRVTRVYLALKDMAEENGYDTLAVQCWSKIQELYRVVPCMAYSWLGSEDGFSVACEGDVQGAISMYLLNLLTGSSQSSTLLDMAALDPATNYMMMFHCGVTPRHFANADGIRWVDHVTLGRNTPDNAYGVAGDHIFAAQEDTTITYVGDDGSSLLVVRASIVEHDVKGFDGTRGWFTRFELNKQPVEAWDLINTLTVRGHEHHFAVGIGDVTDELMEFAAWKDLRLMEHVPYADYLQREGVNA
jgi:L-fucose isomerase-like protein